MEGTDKLRAMVSSRSPPVTVKGEYGRTDQETQEIKGRICFSALHLARNKSTVIIFSTSWDKAVLLPKCSNIGIHLQTLYCVRLIPPSQPV